MPTATLYARPRTSRLAVRFFWKECRRLWGLALGLAVLGVLLMLFIVTFAAPQAYPPGLLAVTAIGAGAMLAVAAAVTIFSVEEEEGTADLLARLPRNAAAMTLGKVSAALTVVGLTTLVLCLAAEMIAGDFLSRQLTLQALIIPSVILIFEAFAWGLVASLICPNPLVAAVLGIFAASVSYYLATCSQGSGALSYTADVFIAASLPRLLSAVIAALVAGWLSSRWPAPLWPARGRAGEAANPQAAERAAGPFGESLGVLGRLVWQTLRESWIAALGAVLLGLFLTFVAYLVFVGMFKRGDLLWFVPWLASLFAPALVGVVVFRADQRRNAYRFLAEHAGRPRMVWLARNAVWLTLLVAVTAIATGLVAKVATPQLQQELWYHGQDAQTIAVRAVELTAQTEGLRWLVLLSVVAAYAFGQYFSLSVKSTVIAAMLAMGSAVLLAAWGLVVWAWWLPTNYFVAPLTVFPLVASWLRARDWMFDRRGVWRWIAPGMALVAPLVWIAWATPGARLSQVGEPWNSIQVGPKEYDKFPGFVEQSRTEVFQGRDVRDAYERLAAEVGESAGVGLADDELDELDRLSRIRCRLPVAVGPKGELLPGQPQDTLSFMVTQDERDEGRLERLLVARRLGAQDHNGRPLQWGPNWQYLADELVEWATTKGRASKELLTTIEELRKIEDLMLRPSERLMNQYFAVRSVLTGDEPISSVRGELGGAEWLAFTAHESLPFERDRSFKALDAMASLRVAYLAEREQTTINAYRDPVFVSRLPEEGPFYPEDDVSIATSPSDRDHHLLSVFQLKHARTSYLASLAWGEPQLDGPLRDWKRGLAWRRAERTRLALIAYRLDHDGYPEKLEALAPDYLAAGELHDLYSGQPLGWEPKGFDLPVADAGQDAIVEGTPVLWSGGMERQAPQEGLACWRDERQEVLVPFENYHYQNEQEAFPAKILPSSGFALAVPE